MVVVVVVVKPPRVNRSRYNRNVYTRTRDVVLECCMKTYFGNGRVALWGYLYNWDLWSNRQSYGHPDNHVYMLHVYLC